MRCWWRCLRWLTHLIEMLRAATTGTTVSDLDLAAVLRARADARDLSVNPFDAPARDKGRHRVLRLFPPSPQGLASMVDAPALTDAPDPDPVVRTPTALLRVRAFTAAAARSLSAVSVRVLRTADVVALSQAADEVLICAGGTAREACACSGFLDPAR